MAKKTQKRADGTRERSNAYRATQRARYAKQYQDIQTVEIPRITAANRKKRERLESDPESWIWEICGPKSGLLEPLTRRFTAQDLAMIHSFFDGLNYGGDEITLAPRGSGKTSRLRECLTMAMASGRLTYGAYFGATKVHASDTIVTIKGICQESAPFRKLYPEIAIPAYVAGPAPIRARGMRATGRRFDNDEPFESVPIGFTWSDWALVFPDVPGSPSASTILKAYGLDSAVRGLNHKGRRPDGVFIDDPDTPNTVDNPAMADKVIRRLHTDIGGLKGEGRRMCRMMLATLSDKGQGVAYDISSEESPFVVNQFSFMERKPQRMDLWTKYVELRKRGTVDGDKHGRQAHSFYLKNRKAMDAGAKVGNKHRYTAETLPDGSQTEVSAIQFYFNEWADKGENFVRFELDNERLTIEDDDRNKLTQGDVSYRSVGDRPRLSIPDETTNIFGGVDIRKNEIHSVGLSRDPNRHGRIFDYNIFGHGSTETNVAQAEGLILEGLQRFEDYQDGAGMPIDDAGDGREYELTLIDKGWRGSYKVGDASQWKTWATQPVEEFAMAAGIHRFLPAHGHPAWKAPEASINVIVGDYWHINLGVGKMRQCPEVIWDKSHWSRKVEELFSMDVREDYFALELFQPDEDERSQWCDHVRFSSHIVDGLTDFYWRRAHPSSKANLKRHDHWFDALTMAMVAQSIAANPRWRKFRTTRQGKRKRQSLADLRALH